MTRVSVLMAAFDAAATVAASLESVAAQTFADWECVVVNDGFRDDTGIWVEALASQNERVDLLRRPLEGVVDAGLMPRSEPR